MNLRVNCAHSQSASVTSARTNGDVTVAGAEQGLDAWDTLCINQCQSVILTPEATRLVWSAPLHRL